MGILRSLFNQSTLISEQQWSLLKELDLCNCACNQDSNYVGDQGCKNFTKCQWSHLTSLDLCKESSIIAQNPITEKGAKYLSKAHWPALSILDLSTVCVIETKVMSTQKKVVSISPRVVV